MTQAFENNMEERFSTSKSVSKLNCLSMVDNGSVIQLIKKRIEIINDENQESEEDDAFFVADIGEIKRQHIRWKSLLPRIEPFYGNNNNSKFVRLMHAVHKSQLNHFLIAVKSNADPLVLKTLADLGAGFDCASKVEIQKVLEVDVDPSRIVFAQTTKQHSYLRHARKHKVKLMTFDNEDELYKIKHEYPEAELLLRIHTEDAKALIRNFGLKFGALPGSTKPLLQLARELGLNIIGVR